jgi:hypothetical protein
MIKLAYDNYDYKRRFPYPNGWHIEMCKYADTINDGDYLNNSTNYFNKLKNKFQIRTSHSELAGTFIHNRGDYTRLDILDIETYNGPNLYYPIEIFGNSMPLLNDTKIINEDNIEYTTFLLDCISEKSIQLAKKNKLVYVWNISHEPFSDIDFIKKLTTVLDLVGLTPHNFLIFGGSSNLFDLYPELKNTSYNFCFENNLLISSCKKIVNLKEQPNHALGYKTEWFEQSELLQKRNKHFVSPNRNSNKPHRFTLGCYFQSENLWNKVYCSFLQKNGDYIPMVDGLDIYFRQKMVDASKEFIKIIPIEMDTQFLNENEKECFESMRAFKKEIYTDSYINIVTETNFEKDIFITEKIINPITVLQPFILFGAPYYLKYIKELGFKTFDGFIDESYDNEIDTGLRFKKLCNEIKRISEISIDEIHQWYINIMPILEYNRNFAIEFAKKPMFINSLNNYKWNLEEKQF